jgi:hypothetical protein
MILYFSEWQWEQWSQQLMSDIRNTTRGPGPRMGSSLWFDGSAISWWLFGGRQAPSGRAKNNTKLKIYTDLWRYDTNARNWSRIFPNDKLKGNVGGMILLRTNLFNDGHARKATETTNNPGVVLCGRSEGKRLDERSLAVYGPRSSHSDTVWQLELKDKQWTSYVCCCDNTERSTGQSAKNNSTMPTGTVRNEGNITRNFSVIHGSILVTDDDEDDDDDDCNDSKLNQNLQEEIDKGNNIDNTENNTKKSKDNEGQNKTLEDSIKLGSRESNALLNDKEIHENIDNKKKERNESIPTHSPIVEKFAAKNSSLFSGYNNGSVRPKMNDSDYSVQHEGHSILETGKHCLSDMEHQNVGVLMNNVSSSSSFNDLSEDHTEEATTAMHNLQRRDVKPNNDTHQQKPKFDATSNDSSLNQAFCPYFEVDDNSNERSRGQPVAWCDTNRELLVALDLRVIPLTLWQFDLRTSHWAQQKVNMIVQ